MKESSKLLELGQKIRNYRVNSELSQFDLESKINAAPGSLSRIENGQVNPTKETLEKIAEALNISRTQKAELYDVGIFSPENILERLNWLAESSNLQELEQRASDILFQLHRNYNGGGIFKLEEDLDTIRPMYVSNMPGLELLGPFLNKSISEFTMSLSKDEENFVGQTIKTLEYRESIDLSDFAIGRMNRTLARSVGKLLKFNVGITYPLFVDKKVYGAVFFTKTKELSFDEYEKKLLSLLAKHIGINITNIIKRTNNP